MIAAMHINVKVGIAQEMAHSERNSHSKSRGGTKPKMRISHACQG